MLDLVIRGAHVVDGASNPRTVDVGVQGNLVTAVASGLGAARRTIDARGKLLTPGFIDIHTHSDFTLPLRPSAEAKLLQGVTTDVTGNCGFSPFPLDQSDSALRHGAFFEPELSERWPSLSAYAENVEAIGLGINLVPLVGLGAIRLAVLGEDDARADAAALAHMSRLLSEALSEGAFGASSGLVYAPSSFANKEELSQLARVVASHGGIYATHVRNEGDGVDEAVDEAIDVAKSCGCRLQISHLKTIGRANWGRIREVLARIDDANRFGCDVWADVYPYTAASSTLASLLPAEVLDGGQEALRRRLAQPNERRRLAGLLEEESAFALADVVFASVPGHAGISGERLVDVARRGGKEASEIVIEMLAQDGARASVVAFCMAEEDVRLALTHPRTVVGSDGWTMTTDAAPYAHPRNFASAVRVLAHYVRDERVLELNSAVAKLAFAPARRLGLDGRGVISPGAVADLAVLDLEHLSERSDFSEPCVYPTGIEYVVVNGQLAVEGGQVTSEQAGRVLRKASRAPHG